MLIFIFNKKLTFKEFDIKTVYYNSFSQNMFLKKVIKLTLIYKIN